MLKRVSLFLVIVALPLAASADAPRVSLDQMIERAQASHARQKLSEQDVHQMIAMQVQRQHGRYMSADQVRAALIAQPDLQRALQQGMDPALVVTQVKQRQAAAVGAKKKQEPVKAAPPPPLRLGSPDKE